MQDNSYVYNLGLLFDRISKKFDERIAVVTENECFDYNYVNTLSNKIAHYILSLKIKQYDTVAILNDKSVEAYSIMIACLKIGVTYTNLDPESPMERFIKMTETSNAKILFHYDSSLPTTRFGKDIANVSLVDYRKLNGQNKLDDFSESLPDETKYIHSNSCAYIMFTSGSTGFPKGVAISHQNVLNFIKWSETTYETTKTDVFTNINPMHFDNSVFDFYSSLFTGASIISVSQNLTKNPRRLLDYLNSKNPTIWFSVPSMLVYVLNMRALKEKDLMTLRIVTFGGEGFPKNQLKKLWSFWGSRVKFINVYGPTECTCICSSYVVKPTDIENDELLPLGFMAPNFYGKVLNESLEEVRDGEIGELYIGGPNVGIGYYNNQTKTNEMFISNPINNSLREVIYKSGDLVKKNVDNEMFYFCGRQDNQIKRMGYRIELEEIENALNAIDFIEESAVIYIDNKKYKSKIFAYLRTANKDQDHVKVELLNFLPAYMIPDDYFYLENLPKNQNGKINRLKLKENFDI